MNLNYFDHNQVMTSIAAALSYVVLLLSQMSTSCSTWYTSIVLSNALYSIPIKKTSELVLFQLARPAIHLHYSISGLQKLSSPIP